MSRFLLRRLRQTLLLLFLLSLFVFLLFELIPGDYLTEMELNPSVSTQRVEQLRSQYGLDKPFYVQYFLWLKAVASGNLGYSFAQQRPAAALISERMLNTLLLSTVAFLMTLLMVFPIGIFSALYSGRWPDRLGSAFSLLGLSFPPLLLALFALYFAFASRWFPLGGLGGPRHWILPGLVLALPLAAYLIRQLRLEMIDALQQPYVLAAAARGLSSTRIVRHALRGALNPLISMLGLSWGALLGGAVVVEKIFNWPGLGLLLVESILSRDLFVALNSILVSALLVIFSTLLADLLLAWNDPRIRYQ